MTDPAIPTIAEAAGAIARKALSPVELVQACLDRIARHEPALHCFITLTADEALAAARAAETEIARSGLILLLTISGPLLLTSLIVGTAIGLLQALTQVQEATLTFVPKLLAMGVVMLLSLPMIGDAMADFTGLIGDKIVTG